MTSHVLTLFRNAAGLAVYAYDVAAYHVRDRLRLFNVDEVDVIVEDHIEDLKRENADLRRSLDDARLARAIAEGRLNHVLTQLARRPSDAPSHSHRA